MGHLLQHDLASHRIPSSRRVPRCPWSSVTRHSSRGVHGVTLRAASNNVDPALLGSGTTSFNSLVSAISIQHTAQPNHTDVGVPIPGPKPWSWDSVSDVSQLLV